MLTGDIRIDQEVYEELLATGHFKTMPRAADEVTITVAALNARATMHNRTLSQFEVLSHPLRRNKASHSL